MLTRPFSHPVHMTSSLYRKMDMQRIQQLTAHTRALQDSNQYSLVDGPYGSKKKASSWELNLLHHIVSKYASVLCWLFARVCWDAGDFDATGPSLSSSPGLPSVWEHVYVYPEYSVKSASARQLQSTTRLRTKMHIHTEYVL